MKAAPLLLPEPRSYAGTAIVLASATALPFAIGWSWLLSTMMRQPFGEILPLGLGAGFLFGVFFGLTIAFFLRGETAAIKLSDRKSFLSRLNIAMSQLGYNPATQTGDFFTYKPSFQAGLASGRISVQIEDGQAVVVGPRMYVRRLLKRLAPE